MATSCKACSSSCSAENKILAVILDLDGTLLNTEQATKDVLKELLSKYGKTVDRKKEDCRFGMTHKETAIAVVDDYDLPIKPHQFTQEIMPMYKAKWLKAKPLPGANRLLMHLHKHRVPFALASNSVCSNVDTKISVHPGWKEYFSVIIGSDQVKSGKPSPDIFLEAANQMGIDPVSCLVIEDSLIGVLAAKAAGMKVVAIPTVQTEAKRFAIADSVLHSLLEFQPQSWGLPPFQDWADLALPIEPIEFRGCFSNGLLTDFTDDGHSILPDQVFGVYFGWAKDVQDIFKVVVGIGWNFCSGAAKRKVEVFAIDGSNGQSCNQQLQLLLVGYIRSLTVVENASNNVDAGILEKDKAIAKNALELPMFTSHIYVPS